MHISTSHTHNRLIIDFIGTERKKKSKKRNASILQQSICIGCKLTNFQLNRKQRATSTRKHSNRINQDQDHRYALSLEISFFTFCFEMIGLYQTIYLKINTRFFFTHQLSTRFTFMLKWLSQFSPTTAKKRLNQI